MRLSVVRKLSARPSTTVRRLMALAIVVLRTKETRLVKKEDCGGESGGEPPQWKHMPAPGPVGGLLVEHRIS